MSLEDIFEDVGFTGDRYDDRVINVNDVENSLVCQCGRTVDTLGMDPWNSCSVFDERDYINMEHSVGWMAVGSCMILTSL